MNYINLIVYNEYSIRYWNLSVSIQIPKTVLYYPMFHELSYNGSLQILLVISYEIWNAAVIVLGDQGTMRLATALKRNYDLTVIHHVSLISSMLSVGFY